MRMLVNQCWELVYDPLAPLSAATTFAAVSTPASSQSLGHSTKSCENASSRSHSYRQCLIIRQSMPENWVVLEGACKKPKPVTAYMHIFVRGCHFNIDEVVHNALPFSLATILKKPIYTFQRL